MRRAQSLLIMALVFCAAACILVAAEPDPITLSLESGDLQGALSRIESIADEGERSLWQGKYNFYSGNYAVAAEHLERVVVRNQGNEQYARLQAYYAALAEVHRGSTEIESAHFRFRVQGADALLARYGLECLERTYGAIGVALGYYPGDKVLVEVYSRKDQFAIGSTLSEDVLEKSGTVGIFKFNRIMLLSPQALPLGYSWLDTLSHEYVHLAVHRMSAGRCPLWLHEGIARYHEALWRSAEPQYLTPDAQNHLARARKGKSFVPFARMHPSIVYLKDRDEMALAFAEASTAVDFMKRTSGADAVQRLLYAMAGNDTGKSFKTALGMSENAFEKKYFASLASLPLQESQGVTGDLPAFRKQREEEFVGADQRGLVRLGDRLREGGRPDAACVQYEKARTAEPDNPVILLKLARAHLSCGDPASARKLLEQAAEKNPGYVTPIQALGELLYAAGKHAEAAEAFIKAIALNPFHPDTHRYYARCLLASGDTRGAAGELDACILLDPSDSESRVLRERLRPEPGSGAGSSLAK